jgi:hypothetical protein
MDEQRLKDAEIVRASIKRRWGIVLAGAALLVGAKWAGLTDASAMAITITLAAAAVANVGVVSITRAGTVSWWLIYCLAVIDILIVGGFVALIGPGGLVAGFFVAIMPYAFNEGRGVAALLAMLSAVVYLGAVAAHGAWVADPPVGFAAVPATAYLEALVFLVVATALRRVPASLVARIRITRGVMRQAEAGSLGVRRPGTTTSGSWSGRSTACSTK